MNLRLYTPFRDRQAVVTPPQPISIRLTPRLAFELILLSVVLMVAIPLFRMAAETVPYAPDETHYLVTSRYFHHTFISRDLNHPDWAESYNTRTQPMLARFAVGAALWIQGLDLLDLPLSGDFIFGLSVEENEALGRVPDPWLLNAARAPMIGFAIGTIGLVYLLGRFIAGPLGGLSAAVFTMGSPLVDQSLVRAVPDAMMMFFILLALVLSVIGARRQDGGLGPGWALVIGIALGLALGTKLASLISVCAVLTWSVIASTLALSLANNTGWRTRGVAAWRALRGWLLAVGIALHIFIASNPYLYPNPGLHTLQLFAQLAYENAVVQSQFPGQVLHPLDRPRYVVEGSLVEHTLTARWGYPLEPFLAALGASGIFMQVWLMWRRDRQIRARGLLLVTAFSYFVLVTMAISMAWQRYLIPTMVLSAVLSGIGVAWIVHTLIGLLYASVDMARRTIQTRHTSDIPPTSATSPSH
ncbi:MAG: ArnT family glycosyltransferase [Chloroflexota bacterium]